MFKRIATIAAVLAATTFAQDFSGLKFCINPGHGGNDPANDRFIETTGFWESEGNLTKGLYMRDILEAHGATIVMTRTQNRDEDDLPLSQICDIANQNNVDFFHSIHSNAGGAGRANFPLMLYRGYDDDPVYPEAKQMSDIMWDYLYDTKNGSGMSYDNQNIRGDWDFYSWGTSGLGVLRTLTMPGVLSEGSFHDYIAESFRLTNIGYREHEAWAMARSFQDYYNKADFPTGIIAGICRYPDESWPYYANDDDQYMPVNNIEATLYPGGEKYYGDDNNNGYYFFDSLAPGTYSVVVESEKYNKDSAVVTVSANQSAFSHRFLTLDTTSAPYVKNFSPTPEPLVDTRVIVNFNRPMDTASVNAAFSIAPAMTGTFMWQDGDKRFVFLPDEFVEGPTTFTVEIDTTATQRYGVPLDSVFTFAFSTTAPSAIDRLPTDADSAHVTDAVKIFFDKKMDQAATEAAFSIAPPVAGSISWEDDGKTLAFAPGDNLEPTTEYVATVTTAAKSLWNAPLDAEFSFSFATNSKTTMKTAMTYPVPGQTDASPSAQMRVEFESLVNRSTFSGNVDIRDDQGASIGFTNIVIIEEGGKTRLYIDPATTMNFTEDYTFFLGGDIESAAGLPLGEDMEIGFTIQEDWVEGGTVLERFEEQGGWITEPESSPFSEHMIADETSFGVSAERALYGAKSGKLEYAFNAEAGVCLVYNSNRPSVGTDDAARVGLFVFGDLSYNELEFFFFDGASENVGVVADTIDWTGWKPVWISVGDIPGSGEKQFHSVVVNRLPGGAAKGKIHFDNITVGFTTDADETPLGAPSEFRLAQSYPNPFNPVATIEFDLPKSGRARLAVFNALGERVAVLFDREAPAGRYRADFDASALPSGVYFYRLTADGFSETRKMTLIK